VEENMEREGKEGGDSEGGCVGTIEENRDVLQEEFEEQGR
jgi:hypothetical protein